MSWAGIANNQTISFSNLLNATETSVFIQKAGYPNPFPYFEQITKAEADTYVYIDTSYAPYAAKSSNQLVVKSDLQPSVTFIGLSDERDTIAETCTVPFTVVQTVFVGSNLQVGIQLTGVSVSGNLGYFLILSPISHPKSLYTIGINDDGFVTYLEFYCPF